MAEPEKTKAAADNTWYWISSGGIANKMKMRYKMLIAFVGAITMSTTLFLFFSYYCLHSGYFSGISHEEMRQALTHGEELLSETDFDTESVLKSLESLYEDMDFAVLTE